MTVPARGRESAVDEETWADIGAASIAPDSAHGASPKAAGRPAAEKPHPRPPRTPRDRRALVWSGAGLAVGFILGVLVGLALGFVLRGNPAPPVASGDAARTHPGKAAPRETARPPAEKAEPDAARPDRDRGKSADAGGGQREMKLPKDREGAGESPRPPADGAEPEAKPKQHSSATGFVAGVEKEDDHVLLMLRSEDSTMANYHCYFPPAKADEIGRLKEGDSVRVQGVIESRGFPVVLKECELVK
jgi:hypothetical protein